MSNPHYRGIPQLTIKLLQLLCLSGALPPGPAAHATQREEEGKCRHSDAQHAHLGALQEGGGGGGDNAHIRSLHKTTHHHSAITH